MRDSMTASGFVRTGAPSSSGRRQSSARLSRAQTFFFAPPSHLEDGRPLIALHRQLVERLVVLGAVLLEVGQNDALLVAGPQTRELVAAVRRQPQLAVRPVRRAVVRDA